MTKDDKEKGSGSPSWGALLFKQTTEDVARAVAANSPNPSVIYSSKDDSGGSQFQRLQHQVTKMIKGFSHPTDVNTNYNPEILTSLKRQWAANFQLQHMDHKSWKEPSRLFESMVVVGLHPNCDVHALQRQYVDRKFEGSGKFRSALGYQNQSRIGPNINIEPQVLFVYPPEKRLPLKYKDLLSFCFPGGLEVRSVERTPSMSKLNEILLGQEHLKQRDMSFVFRLQGADNSVLYGCCALVEELVHRPSGLLSLISDKQPSYSSLRRQIFTTQRCYCILSRLPFFELHFSVLNSIFTQERLERLTKGAGDLNLEFFEGNHEGENSEGNFESMLLSDRPVEDRLDKNPRVSQSLLGSFTIVGDAHQMVYDVVVPTYPETNRATAEEESGPTNSDQYGGAFATYKISEDRHLPNAISPLMRYCQYESSESSCSFQGSPCEDGNFRSDVDDNETEDASFSGQEDLNELHDILNWAKENNHGQLQIISEYYHLNCPARGSTLTFHPLDHLHPLEYHRLAETVLCLGGSTVDLKPFSTGLEIANTHNALLAEEATALSIWAVACICGTLRLENVLTFFAGVLLEKQIVVVCSNLGILSALVLSVIALIRPYQWQSLLMPVLPNDMLEFLDAPVPFVVGIKNRNSEVQLKLTNVILVDANRNQVTSPMIPQLPRQKELVSSLRSHHATLVGGNYLGRTRPVYECTEVQIEAAKGFLSVLRSYLDSLCCNIRSHTITNVQSNDDKVSLLLKESFIDSFPYRDRSFMKLFVDTQLFSVHTDLILSFFQKE
ncbi:putative DENN domain-containing protein [Lupinus albus]|uniref:Putative DENN domain-containing protein n=1 Tax=Lupinus albus TaxID=3870 RepID=A0A6A4Q8N6_LUPAL|nr:putative DENN domain-containing protein [Lupinus albus]